MPTDEDKKLAFMALQYDRIQEPVDAILSPIIWVCGVASNILTLYLLDYNWRSIAVFPEESLELLLPVVFNVFLVIAPLGLLAASIKVVFLNNRPRKLPGTWLKRRFLN